MANGMIIDGIAASEAIDSSGEILDVEGCDISDLENGVGVLNWEHRGDDAPGASANDVVGKIIHARKVFKRGDCENERERMYWDRVKLPFIYIKARLFDGSGHPGAVALAAIIRDHVANSEPILVRYSIEGSTLDRDGNRLKTSIARRVAATIKPCNRTAVSGLLEDPNGNTPKEKLQSVEDDPLKALVNKKHEHPLFTRLGGGVAFEGNPLLDEEPVEKTLSAGSYDAAPSTLSGGSALQVEDRSLRMRKMKAQAQAALRDWDHTGTFKSFLKSRMPDADESFVEKFADMVDDYVLKLKKTSPDDVDTSFNFGANVEEGEEGEEGGDEDEGGEEEGNRGLKYDKNKPVTFRGQPLKKNPKLRGPYFDEEAGILHTPEGSFPMYHPDRDPHFEHAGSSFREILANSATLDDKGVQKRMHDYATENWLKVHRALKEGRLPEAIPAASVAFSMLSPNTPVPVHEMMFAHLVDAIKDMGFDLRSHMFAQSHMERNWKGRDQPEGYPEHSRDYFENTINHQIRIKNDTAAKVGTGAEGRSAGQNAAFMLANDKYDNMAKYHRIHKDFVDLVRRHGTDTQAAVAEMMDRKRRATNWNNSRRTLLDGYEEINAKRAAKGLPPKEDPGEFPDWFIPGLKQKTGRFAYAMLGGGNAFVPDTHFTRHLFGLDKDRDANSIAYLKSRVMWHTNMAHILNAMDRWYFKNHPAVQYVLNHPQFGHHFKDDPTQAIFPAFWGHWLAIGPHEKALGYGGDQFQNNNASHRPLFDFYDDLFADPKENAPGMLVDPYGRPLSPEQQERGAIDFKPRSAWIPEHDPGKTRAQRKKAKEARIKREEKKKAKEAAKLGKNEAYVHEDYDLGAPPDFEHMSPHEAAITLKEFQKQHGSAAASLMFYTHIVPKLWPGIHEEKLDPPPQQFNPVKLARSLQAAVIDLRAAVHEITTGEPMVKAEPAQVQEPEEIHYAGKRSRPGLIEGTSPRLRGQKFHVVHEDGNSFFVVPHELGGQFDHDDVRTIAKKNTGKTFKVVRPLMPLAHSNTVDSTMHGVAPFMSTPEQHDLVHGLTLDQSLDHLTLHKLTPEHAQDGSGKWMKGPKGMVYVKNGQQAHFEAATHELARDVFGLGAYVPTTALVKHPATGDHHAVIDTIPDGSHLYNDEDIPENPHYGQILGRAADSGDLDMMMVMDLLTGNDDRHEGNVLYTPTEMKLIDHGGNFRGSGGQFTPVYLEHHATSKTGKHNDWRLMRVHPKAVDWIRNMDPSRLKVEFAKFGVPTKHIGWADDKLRALKSYVAQNPTPTRGAIWDKGY